MKANNKIKIGPVILFGPEIVLPCGVVPNKKYNKRQKKNRGRIKMDWFVSWNRRNKYKSLGREVCVCVCKKKEIIGNIKKKERRM